MLLNLCVFGSSCAPMWAYAAVSAVQRGIASSDDLEVLLGKGLPACETSERAINDWV